MAHLIHPGNALKFINMRWLVVTENDVIFEDHYERALLYGKPEQIPIFVNNGNKINPVMSVPVLVRLLNDGGIIMGDKYEQVKELKERVDGWPVYAFGSVRAKLIGPSLKYNHLVII